MSMVFAYKLSPERQKKLDKVIDMAYDYLEAKAAPKKSVPQHRLTKIDINDVQAALAELAVLRDGNIYDPSSKHIKAILEMLYAYGVDEAQGRLEVD